MRPSVTVPVLSVQMTSAAPTISTTGSERTSAFRSSIRRVPNARTSVSTTGSPSGTAATARATAVMNVSSRLRSPVSSCRAATIPMSTATTHPIRVARRPTSRWKTVGSLAVVCTSAAIPPTSVRMPVRATSIRPRPRMATAPLYAIQDRSASDAPSETCWVLLRTGRLSPVSAASSTLRSMLLMTRPSAGMREPSSSSTTSPGTSTLASTCSATPSRSTVAEGAASRFSDSMPRLAR